MSNKCCIILHNLNKGLQCTWLLTKSNLELWWIKNISWDKHRCASFCMRSSIFVYLITQNEWKWMYVLSCIIVARESLPIFYIFKRKQFWQNFIEKCETGTIMTMQPKAWMTTILFEKWISHFIAFIQVCKGNLTTTNHHLLILDDQFTSYY
jgi:hypothetical protein